MRRTNTSDRTRTWLTALGAVACLAIIAASPAQAQAPQEQRLSLGALAHTPGGTFESPSLRFRWAIEVAPGVVDGQPRTDQIVLRGGRAARCRSIHLEFTAGGQAQSAQLLVFQGGSAPATAEANSDRAAKLDVALRPGRPWMVAASTPASSISAFVKGSARCRGGAGISTAA